MKYNLSEEYFTSVSQENYCTYVSSRGIMKSCDVYPEDAYSGPSTYDDHLAKLNNVPPGAHGNVQYLHDILKDDMKENLVIYVCTDNTCYFAHNILPKIKKPFVLVSGDSDLTVPTDVPMISYYTALIESKYLIKWFAQNATLTNSPKLLQFPIGLDYHTIANDPKHKWNPTGENSSSVEQERMLMQLEKKPFYERQCKIYCNTAPFNDRHGQRSSSIREIPPELLVVEKNVIPREETWKNMLQYTFILSPSGMGFDCHRSWEGFVLGSIVILQKTDFTDGGLYDELPVLIVNNWSDITKELLEDTIEKFKGMTFNYEKTKLKYWMDKTKV